MDKQQNSLAERLTGWAGQPIFFRLILGLLIAQAAWIALSSRYPMAFDEDFHLGIIRLYAHHLSPFWSGQPENADMFGAVARDPSYLYQYLLSWPYRLISLFTNDQTIQVLILRAINISLFAGGLALYRRLLLKTGASQALAHFCLLIMVLIPIVPLLAAQINYDNLFLPLVALTLLGAVKFNGALAERRRPDIRPLLQLLILCLLTSLVKYAFLPIFVVIVVFIAVRLRQTYRSPAAVWSNWSSGWRELKRSAQLALVSAFIVAGGLFVQRYAVNLIRYHAPVPDCLQVLSVEKCSEYGPWIRDYNLKLANVGGPHSPVTFTADWFYGMWLRTFFAVGGPGTNFQSRGPLWLPGVGAIVFVVLAAGALLAAAPRLPKWYKKPVIWLLGSSIVVYAGTIWLDDYRAYLQTGQPVAINGRYLLPVVPLALVIVAASFTTLLRDKLKWKLTLAGLAVLCLSWGGGALTFILRSNDAWYWPSRTVVDANHVVQRLAGPLTPGYYNPAQFLR